jgi:hypothetical protein
MRLVKETTIQWRQSGFPRETNAAISQHESAIILLPSGQGSFFEANIWGMVYYATPIGQRRREFTGIHTTGFIGYLLAFLRHARILLRRVGYTGPLHVELLMHNILNVPWVSFAGGMATTGTSSELDNTVTFTLDATTDELERECDRLAGDLLQCVFFAINWPEVADDADKLATLAGVGYSFNGWHK